MQSQRPDHPSRRRITIVTGVLAASLLGAGTVAAQSPSPSPAASGSTGTTTVPEQGVQRHLRGFEPGGRPGIPGGQASAARAVSAARADRVSDAASVAAWAAPTCRSVQAAG